MEFSRIPEFFQRIRPERHQPQEMPVPPHMFKPDNPRGNITDERHYFFSCNGILVNYPPVEARQPVIVKEGKVLSFGEHPHVAQIDFTPNGFIGKKVSADPELTMQERTAVLAHGLAGLQAFFSFLQEHPELEKPALLYGDTNARMAHTATKLGFAVSENSMSHKQRVYGYMTEIEERITSLFQKDERERSLAEQIIKRASKAQEV